MHGPVRPTQLEPPSAPSDPAVSPKTQVLTNEVARTPFHSTALRPARVVSQFEFSAHCARTVSAG